MLITLIFLLWISLVKIQASGSHWTNTLIIWYDSVKGSLSIFPIWKESVLLPFNTFRCWLSSVPSIITHLPCIAEQFIQPFKIHISRLGLWSWLRFVLVGWLGIRRESTPWTRLFKVSSEDCFTFCAVDDQNLGHVFWNGDHRSVWETRDGYTLTILKFLKSLLKFHRDFFNVVSKLSTLIIAGILIVGSSF